MDKRDAATLKKERLQAINKRLTAPDTLPQDLDYAIAQIEFLDGLSKGKALEYLQTLETLHFISIDDKTRTITEFNKNISEYKYKEKFV